MSVYDGIIQENACLEKGKTAYFLQGYRNYAVFEPQERAKQGEKTDRNGEKRQKITTGRKKSEENANFLFSQRGFCIIILK